VKQYHLVICPLTSCLKSLFFRSARVNCLYFVARGTLDDVLWKLIEKKFRDLGEFVEGKEKLKLVVDKEYNSEKELHSALFDEVAEDSGSDVDDGSDDGNIEQELQFDNDLIHDIEELGEEEQRMLRESEDLDDGDGDPSPADLDTKMPANEAVGRASSKGLSEDDAIALSDDEDDTAGRQPSARSAGSPQPQPSTVRAADVASTAAGIAPVAEDPTDILSGCRLYRIIFGDKRLGLEISLYNRRVVVTRVTEERRLQLGEDSKPAVGDILAGIGGLSLIPTGNLDAVLGHLRQVLQQPPTELMFVEAPLFVEEFKRYTDNLSQKSAAAAPPPLPPAAAPPSSSNDVRSRKTPEVVELLDDE